MNQQAQDTRPAMIVMPFTAHIQQVLNGYILNVNGLTYVFQGEGLGEDFDALITGLKAAHENFHKPRKK